jgi:hypothetical protein
MPGDVIPGEKQSAFETAGGSPFPLMNGERTKRVFGNFLPSARRMDKSHGKTCTPAGISLRMKASGSIAGGGSGPFCLAVNKKPPPARYV